MHAYIHNQWQGKLLLFCFLESFFSGCAAKQKSYHADFLNKMLLRSSHHNEIDYPFQITCKSYNAILMRDGVRRLMAVRNPFILLVESSAIVTRTFFGEPGRR